MDDGRGILPMIVLGLLNLLGIWLAHYLEIRRSRNTLDRPSSSQAAVPPAASNPSSTECRRSGKPTPPQLIFSGASLVALWYAIDPTKIIFQALLVCAFLAAAVGVTKNEGFISFLVGLTLGPIGLLMAICSSGRK